MKHLINKFVKSIGASIILRSKKFDGLLTYFLIDWIGTDSQYYSLLAICNDTQIITRQVLLLGDCDDGDFVNPLQSNLRQSSSKESWVRDRWDLEEVKKIDEFLTYKLNWIESLDYCSIDCNGYETTGVSLILRPVFEYAISYSDAGHYRTLVLPMNGGYSINADSKEHYEFLIGILETLGISKYFKLNVEKHEYAD